MRYLLAFITAMCSSAAAFAAEPTPGALGFQEPATRIMERVEGFHFGVLVVITIISVFVLALLIWVAIAFNRKANPEPRKFSHNTLVEIVWTVVPVIILIVIAAPSFSNLFYQENEPDLEAIAESGDLDDPNVFVDAAEQGWITIKAQGNQWNWTYFYKDILDDGGFPLEFVSNPLHVGTSIDAPVTADRPRLLAVDYPMVIPVNRYIRYETAASDVIHSWTVPSFGVKTDAVPGRLNSGWFLVTKEGTFYGQCSELCGKNHAYMPIEVRVVSQEAYDRWVEIMLTGDFDAATEFVQTITPADDNVRLAMAE
ncbi:MAG: cytochrome c oxidase subunit II [Pseudomonadota bacterium]